MINGHVLQSFDFQEHTGVHVLHWTEEHEASLTPWQPRKNQLSEAETMSLRRDTSKLIEWGAVVARIELKIMGMMNNENRNRFTNTR